MRPSFLALMVAACAGTAPAPPPIENRATGGPGPGAIPDGWYACQLEVDSWVYAFHACEVRAEGDHHVLEKVEGQMRFTGVIEPEGGGFKFAGERWCTYATDCRYPAIGSFVPADAGGWEGRFPPTEVGETTVGPIRIYLLPEATLRGFGGTRYGGGHGDGGWTYGEFPMEVPR
jgi:hypothetical protein